MRDLDWYISRIQAVQREIAVLEQELRRLEDERNGVELEETRRERCDKDLLDRHADYRAWREARGR
jgi:hypothetical protein